MSIRLEDIYPSRVNPATGAYPDGEVRNESAPGANDGTPYDEVWFRDISGFFQKIILDAAITPSGVPDTALASDYLDGLQAILQGTFIRDAREGGRYVRDSVALFTTQPCAARTADNTSQMTLATAMQKDAKVAWTQGDGNGGTPTALLPLTNQMYRRFLVATPAGVTDIVLDTDPAAATFFADATAIGAGFTDATLYRRLSHVPVDSGLDLAEVINSEVDWRVFYWADSMNVGAGAPTDATDPRVAVDMSDAIPPQCIGMASAYMTAILTANGNEARLLVTNEEQNDTNPSTGTRTATLLQRNNSQDNDNLQGTFYGQWETNASQEIFYRWWDNKGGTGVTTFTSLVFQVDGWNDPGIVA